jgi:diaminopimelate decarboxylase/aspartate kinase
MVHADEVGPADKVTGDHFLTAHRGTHMPQDAETIVAKFGGTSVDTKSAWRTIDDILDEYRAHGCRPFFVCSAVAGTSDQLEQILNLAEHGSEAECTHRIDELEAQHNELADRLGVDDTLLVDLLSELRQLVRGVALTGEITPRLRARVMSTGELLSTTMGAAFLDAEGWHVQYLDARDWLTSHPDDGSSYRHYLSASCDHTPDPALVDHIDDEADVVVTQGFIGRDPDGQTVLLGRGGSDTSAAYFAAKLQADRTDIWTDVPGMFTANPQQVPSAHLLQHLDYDEAQELATMGADVLHPRCIDPLRETDIPLHIRSTRHRDVEGTEISSEVRSDSPQVKAISAKGDVTLISMETLGMWQEVGFLADAFACFKQQGLSIDLVATSETNVTVSLDPSANDLSEQTLESLKDDLSELCRPTEYGPCAAVSLVGRHIRSILPSLGPAMSAFDEQSVHLLSQAASDLNFTFVVDEDQQTRLVRELHSLLFDERQQDALLGPTWQAIEEGPSPHGPDDSTWWVNKQDALLRLGRRGDGARFVYDEERLQKTCRALDGMNGPDRVFYAMKANPNPEILQIAESQGLGFECVAPGEIQRIFEVLPDIDPDRILFTPNFSPPADYKFAFDKGVHVTVDSLHPLREWPELFDGRDIFLRLDPGRGRGHHDFVQTAGSGSKFGIAPNRLSEAATLVDSANATVVGLHAHLGSGIQQSDTWSETGQFLASTAERFDDVKYLDVGGGIGLADQGTPPAVSLLGIDEGLSRLNEAHPGFEFWLEPGRFAVAESGVLVAQVTQVKQKGNNTFVGIETGMNSLIRPALYGAYHPIVNLSKIGEPPTMAADIVGPICESADVMGRARRLPHTEEGDVMLIANSGAYGRAMSSHYNLRPPANEELLER